MIGNKFRCYPSGEEPAVGDIYMSGCTKQFKLIRFVGENDIVRKDLNTGVEARVACVFDHATLVRRAGAVAPAELGCPAPLGTWETSGDGDFRHTTGAMIRHAPSDAGNWLSWTADEWCGSRLGTRHATREAAESHALRSLEALPFSRTVNGVLTTAGINRAVCPPDVSGIDGLRALNAPTLVERYAAFRAAVEEAIKEAPRATAIPDIIDGGKLFAVYLSHPNATDVRSTLHTRNPNLAAAAARLVDDTITIWERELGRKTVRS